jgi:WD40 repeat protein
MSSDLVCFSQWVRCVVAMSDGRRVVSGSEDNTLRVWDVDTGECVRVLKGHGGVSEC